MDKPLARKPLAGVPARRRSALDIIMGSGLGKLFGRIGIAPRAASSESLLDLAAALLSLRGRASGPALASAFFDLYEATELSARHEFLTQLHTLNVRDSASIDKAIKAWNEKRDDSAAQALNTVTESPIHKLIHLLNLAPQGTQRLIAMRSDLLSVPERTAGLKLIDQQFEDAFSAWFNAGFLELRRLGWDTPANVLEKIIRYEAVHSISGWNDLRGRVEPADRRCYGFFHPQMADEPLIFVEVALTEKIPGAIADVISEDRTVIDPHQAHCAIFYSISNCQTGLRGIPFGNYLIKRVVGLLQQELPQLDCFATLSPVPGFARWMAKEHGADTPVPEGQDLQVTAARYLVNARTPAGGVVDPVARFHLGNGARLDAVHLNGDLSPNGLRQAHGIMVNYVYDLQEIEANHFALTELGTVTTSRGVQGLVDGLPPKEIRGKGRRQVA